MRSVKSIGILLAAMCLAVFAYPRYEDDDHDYEQHRDDYNDSQESMEQTDDPLDSLNIDHGHIDYYKHHKDMYEEPTHSQYDFTYEIKALKAGKKPSKLKKQSKSKYRKKKVKGSLEHKTSKTTERIVYYPAYSTEGASAFTTVLNIRHDN